MAYKIMSKMICKSMCEDFKNIENSLEKCVFRTFRKLDFGAVLGVGSAAKVVSKRSRGTSHEKKFMLIVFDNSIGADLQTY